MSTQKKVQSVEELVVLAARSRSVTGFYANGKPTPCAFLISMPARNVVNMVRRGLFLYEPKAKSRGWTSETLKKVRRKTRGGDPAVPSNEG